MTRESVISIEGFRDGMRDAVLKALDAYVRETVGHEKAMGARDRDLPDLFKAIDHHAKVVAERFNDKESTEPGSAFVRFDMGE
jgi:hypothetical protein